MQSVPLEIAHAKLPHIIDTLKPDESVAIAKDEQVIARLSSDASPVGRQQREPGGAIGILKVIADDEGHLNDFKEYMS
ncbi:MAG: hypothetical protein K2X38_25235 [Gemmataceae bacterium]|nr:hypothetical protein [Gemmataceae bacterium]